MDANLSGFKVDRRQSQDAVGNAELISKEEELVSALLRDANLKHTNEISAEVNPQDTFYTRYGKRALDFAIALPAFVVTLPFNAVFGILTFLDVGKPIFFKQTRVGRGGKHFTIVKFRNMNEEKDDDGRLLPPAQRVTKFGKFMRKFSLDELLNLWSVLKGDMSIIGPRPLPVVFYDRMSNRHKQRSAVRPGLECPRVIHVENEDFFRYHRTFENDVWYAENVSLPLDLHMFFLLVKMTFTFKERNRQAGGQGMSYFVGYSEDGMAISLNNYRHMQDQHGA